MHAARKLRKIDEWFSQVSIETIVYSDRNNERNINTVPSPLKGFNFVFNLSSLTLPSPNSTLVHLTTLLRAPRRIFLLSKPFSRLSLKGNKGNCLSLDRYRSIQAREMIHISLSLSLPRGFFHRREATKESRSLTLDFSRSKEREREREINETQRGCQRR